MNPHIATPSRPSSTQWIVGKHSPLLSSLRNSFLGLFFLLLLVLFIQSAATRRAVRACNTGYKACRISMGYSLDRVNTEDPNEDQTVCGDGWRACREAAVEGNIQ